MKKLIFHSFLALSFAVHAAPPGRETPHRAEPAGKLEAELRKELNRFRSGEISAAQLPAIASRLINRACSTIPHNIMTPTAGEIAGLHSFVLKSDKADTVRHSTYNLALTEILRLADLTHSKDISVAQEAAMTLFLISSAGNNPKIMPLMGGGNTPAQIIAVSKAVAEMQGSEKYRNDFKMNYIRGIRAGKDMLTALREADAKVPATGSDINARSELNKIVSDVVGSLTEGRYEKDFKALELRNKSGLTRADFVTASNRLLESAFEAMPKDAITDVQKDKIYEMVNRYTDINALKQILNIAEGLHSDSPSVSREAALTLKLIAVTANETNRPRVTTPYFPGLSNWQIISIAQKVAGVKGLSEFVDPFIAKYIIYSQMGRPAHEALKDAHDEAYASMTNPPTVVDINQILLNPGLR